MRIVALDLGATTGFAYGDGVGAPTLGHWPLQAKTAAKRGWLLEDALGALCDKYMPDVLWIEAPPNLQGMLVRGTNIATLQSLYGYDMVAGMVAAKRGVRVEHVDAQVARRHFVGKQPPKGQGKKVVQMRCDQIGWEYDCPDEADAACVWDYACARENPNRWMKAVQDHAARVS